MEHQIKTKKHHRVILQEIAHRAMLERGLLPDFSTEALAELDRMDRSTAADGNTIRDLRNLLLFGPGEAKGELVKRLETKGLKERIVEVETMDKMTDNQIAAKVRDHFLT